MSIRFNIKFKHKKEVIMGLITIAICIFILLWGVSISNKSVYGYAINAYNNKSYTEALELFNKIPKYKDSKQYIDKITNIIAEEEELQNTYIEAKNLYNEGKYFDAMKLFNSIKGYNESDVYIELCKMKLEN